MGDLRRLEPVSENWGFDRGTPLDRYFIERFLADQALLVRGRVLEIGDTTYARRFGGNRVSTADVLRLAGSGPEVTFVGDLSEGAGLPSDAFDCVILTQTLQFIPEPHRALDTVHRALKPGGNALITIPFISRLDQDPDEQWSTQWGFTSHGAARMAASAFPDGTIETHAYGNVLVASAFLQGLAAEELTEEELAHADPNFEVLISVRATKRS